MSSSQSVSLERRRSRNRLDAVRNPAASDRSASPPRGWTRTSIISRADGPSTSSRSTALTAPVETALQAQPDSAADEDDPDRAAATARHSAKALGFTVAVHHQPRASPASDSTRVSAHRQHGRRRGHRRLPGQRHAAGVLGTADFQLHQSRPPHDTITIDGQQVSINPAAKPRPGLRQRGQLQQQRRRVGDRDRFGHRRPLQPGERRHRHELPPGLGHVGVADRADGARSSEGRDAMFSVDGVSGTSSSNTVTNAIAGVSLSLNGVTTTSGSR